MADLKKLPESLNGYTSGSTMKNSSNLTNQLCQIFELLIFVLFWSFQVLYYIGESVYRLFYQKEPKSVKNDVVLITGTGHGIGKQLALKYAGEGATVVGWDINKENNDQTIKEINERYQNKAYGYVVDVANADNVVDTARLVENQVGQVTILIANAGIMPCRPLMEHSREVIKKLININVMQIFWLLEAFLPTMIKNNRGHVVAMSSVAGLAGFTNLVPYCATKFAVRGLMESLHEEVRMNSNNQIKFTTIFPFMVDTGLCKNPRIKFDTFMKILKPDEVAQNIMMAQRTDMMEVSLPSYILPLQIILRTLPKKAVYKLLDFLDSGIDSDLLKNTSD